MVKIKSGMITTTSRCNFARTESVDVNAAHDGPINGIAHVVHTTEV